ncbi:hypothetical protein D1872_284770 [compost metagenome]
MTSPSEPVVMNLPLPFTAATSMVSNSPPTDVQARPFTRPTCASSSAIPKSNLCGPKYSGRLAEVISSCKFLDFLLTASFTTLRAILDTSRSKLRTPASRV